MTARRYPSAPWRLHGRAILLPALVRAPKSRRPPVAGGGRTLGGLLLATYGPGSTLVYHELLAVGGIVRSGLTPAAWITHAHVDDVASIAGGRAIWGIPKEHAAFRWDETAGGLAVSVSAGGREVVTVTASPRRRRVPVPVAAPFVGRDGLRRAWALGWLRATPAAVGVVVAPDSPLASLDPVFGRSAIVGDVALRVGAPRRRPSR